VNSNQANSAADLENELSAAVKYVAARQPIDRSAIESELAKRNLVRWSATRRSKTLVRIAKDFRSRGHFGRLRAVTLIGITELGESFLSALERSGVFLARNHLRSKMGKFLSAFATEVNSNATDWGSLGERLNTYRRFARLSDLLAHDEDAAAALLSRRPRFVLKPILALANLAFLRSYMGFDLPAELNRRLESAGPPETIASIVSVLFALANSKFELDSFDLGLPYVGDVEDPSLWALIEHGRALVEVHEIAQHISLFGYILQERQAVSGSIFYVSPPTPEFEYSLRLGYARAKMHKGPSVAELENEPEITMMTLAELFVNDFRNRVCEVRDPGTPFRRVRTIFPMMPELFQMVTTARFADDVSDRESLAQEFMYPLRWAENNGGKPFPLTPTLTLEAFMKMWRVSRFFSLVDIAAIRPYVEQDYVTFANSLVRVTKDAETAEMLTAAGFAPAEAKEFVDLVGASVRDFGYYDLQYRPYIHIAAASVSSRHFQSPPETIHLPALVATTNVLRNVQMANRIRFRDLPHIFVRVLSDLFKGRFQHVTSNRKIRTEEGDTDIDIVVYTGTTIYLFECKHSVYPTGPHETRDILEDIEKGVKQIRLAMAALSRPEAQRQYLSHWFPGVELSNVSELSVSSGILCSHRVMCGVEWDGVPVRDYASLSKLIEDGIISVTTAKDEMALTMTRFCLVDEAGFSSDDLDDYLAPNSRYLSMYRRFMRPICRPEHIGNLTIAYETYVLDLASDEWLEHMEQISARRLPDEHHEIKHPKSWQDWLAGRDHPNLQG
jgi:hypothetical protein